MWGLSHLDLHPSGCGGAGCGSSSQATSRYRRKPSGQEGSGLDGWPRPSPRIPGWLGGGPQSSTLRGAPCTPRLHRAEPRMNGGQAGSWCLSFPGGGGRQDGCAGAGCPEIRISAPYKMYEGGGAPCWGAILLLAH